MKYEFVKKKSSKLFACLIFILLIIGISSIAFFTSDNTSLVLVNKDREGYNNTIQGFHYGIMFILFLVNLILYLSLKHESSIFIVRIRTLGMRTRVITMYIVSCVILFLGFSLKMLAIYSIVPLNFITLYSQRICEVITIVLLSISLRDRFNIMSQEKVIEEERGILLESLHNITKTITSSNDIGEIANFSLQSICKITKFQNGMIVLKEEQDFVVKAIIGYKADELKNGILFGVEENVYFNKTIKEISSVILSDLEMSNYGIDKSFKSFIIFPIEYNEKNVGIIILYDDIVDAPNKTQYQVLYNFVGQIGIAIENARLFNQVKKMAITDGLTGVFNRTHFLKLTEALIEECSNYSRDLSLIMLDIDNFKKINDTHGHLVGDNVLQQLVAMLKVELNGEFIIGRYGGEEFLVLLKDANLKTALDMAEKLRSEAERMKVNIDKDNFVKFTISIGVANTNGHISKISQLIEKADKALYISKENGRNQVRTVQDLV